MASRGKVIIVGAGIAGLSTAWGLVRRGFAVEVFEQGPVPNPKASSHDEHRITRHAYGELEGYGELMPAAFRTWEAMWADLGARHYEAMPAVFFLRGASPWLAPTLSSLEAMRIGFRELPVGDVARRFPMIEPDGLTTILETDGAGLLFPQAILNDLVVWLAAAGVRFHPMSQVTDVDPDAATATTAGGGRHAGDALVVAAGAWADRLVPALRQRAVPSRQAVVYLAPPADLAAAWSTAPVLIDLGEASGTYTLPPRRATRLKVGDHRFTRRGDPDGDRAATDDDVERLFAAARLAYRDFDRYTVLERKACFYTVTDDERFVVEAIGPASFLVSACSGHGFKLGALIGDGVAGAIAGERTPAALARWAAGHAATA
jgi:glycine/D-amino acid oxidase-like deaminating enzyme